MDASVIRQGILPNQAIEHHATAMDHGKVIQSVIVDELSEHAQLSCVWKQRTDRVILYFHGTHLVSFVNAFPELICTGVPFFTGHLSHSSPSR
jgi:hypothetical protein